MRYHKKIAIKTGCLIFFMLIILFSCGAHYNNRYNPDKIQNAINSLVVITTIGEVEGLENIEYQGRGIQITNDILLALTHCTSINTELEIRTPFGYVYKKINVTSEKYYVDGEPIELIGRKHDITLFRRYSNIIFPFKYGEFNKLRLCDDLFMIGWSESQVVNVKDGIVSNLKYPVCDGLVPGSRCFLSTTPVNSGDSGSPVLAIRNNEYELIGIVEGYMAGAEAAGAIFPIDYVQDCINDILNFDFDEF